MQKNTTNYNSNIHFWPLVSLGGALGGQNLQRGVVGYFPPPLKFFSKFSWLSFGHKNILRGVVRVNFDFTLLSPHPNGRPKYSDIGGSTSISDAFFFLLLIFEPH